MGLTWMIVCVCNRLNEARIRTAIRSGAACPDEVYARCGVERNCGRCQDEIEQMLDEARTPLDKAA
jgi:bacterioferritin-associated ferredoxin